MYKYTVAQNSGSVHSSHEYSVGRVCYKIATTPALIRQYYALLEKIYQERFSKAFQVTAKEHWFNNQYGKIIVALDEGHTVIGGARVIISSPAHRCLLPLESDLLKLDHRFPHMNLNQCVYSEWGRLIVSSETEEKSIVSENISKICLRISLSYDCHFQFGLTISKLKQRIEDILKNMNLEYREILSSNEMPEYPIIARFLPYLGVTDLRNMHQNKYKFLNFQDVLGYDSNYFTFHRTSEFFTL
jgi:hypothetical protein